jgi:hypothetical protein
LREQPAVVNVWNVCRRCATAFEKQKVTRQKFGQNIWIRDVWGAVFIDAFPHI